MCLEMMDFEGKDEICQKVAKNGTMFQKLQEYMQMALMLAAQVRPDMVQGISRDIMMTMGGGSAGISTAANQLPATGDYIRGMAGNEPANVKNARARAANAAQPGGK